MQVTRKKVAVAQCWNCPRMRQSSTDMDLAFTATEGIVGEIYTASPVTTVVIPWLFR
jgi:hypothetical protein